MLCFRKFLVAKKLRDKRGGGVSRFSVEKFVSQCRKISLGNPLVLHSFRVSKNVRDERRGDSRFSVENFLSHSAENFRRGTLSCFTSFGYRKMLGIYRKNFWQGSDSNPEPTAWEPCCPKTTAVIHFWIKRVGNFGQIKKKEKRPYWTNNFSCILHILRRIIIDYLRTRTQHGKRGQKISVSKVEVAFVVLYLSLRFPNRSNLILYVLFNVRFPWKFFLPVALYGVIKKHFSFIFWK